MEQRATPDLLFPASDIPDVCIYGATSGGVVTAVAASRLGARVVLVESGNHVGGMTSGGLSFTDTGHADTIGGIAREFYRRVGRSYGTGEQFTFEPHIALKVFSDLLTEQGIKVEFGAQLSEVVKEGPRILEIRAVDGRTFKGKMFIDATYEGDLMAKAGVSYIVGRESTSTYQESLNGIRPKSASRWIDPYVIPGMPSSGFLPLVQPETSGQVGEADHLVQAYNYRLCMTQNPSNRLPITPPQNYDPARFELLARIIELKTAVQEPMRLGDFLNFEHLPNGKADVNSKGFVSTDYVGMSHGFPNGSYADRTRMAGEHEAYIRGLLTFLATSPRVPENVRMEMQTWGLCRDEFQPTFGWSPQLYVREARRMVSDYVITQHHCLGEVRAIDSIGFASYSMDSHSCRRTAKPGVVSNEGDVHQVVAGPYPISYRAIVPRVSECENLLVPFCLSASHVAFGSIRMEPVFMITSHSAAVAACLAINDKVPVQQISYQRLRTFLLLGGQIL